MEQRHCRMVQPHRRKTNLRDSHAEFCLQFAACRYFHNKCSGFGFRLLRSGWITKQPRSWVFECIIKPHGASKRMQSEHSNRYLIEEWLLRYDVMILSRLCTILLSHSGCPNEWRQPFWIPVLYIGPHTFLSEVLLMVYPLSSLTQKWLPFIHQLPSLLHDFLVCFLNPSNML